ncbi:hypothetical protein K435DRAFT_833363 [Dendrothele bispora CBS 962.96]|uniref:Thioredoxin domain-containing protein n=1 Tax=Dendrothele bispora (strain CBS 962.96) TaxID=1314807 RepID=A0A4S8MWG2_DENBC|nr:hypothetical protein K435DRAFT_833363 [Dendrothele bispora CBS 962.96]
MTSRPSDISTPGELLGSSLDAYLRWPIVRFVIIPVGLRKLKASDESTTTSELLVQASESFLIFYSSVVNGKLWCPDCQDVEELVKRTFEPEDAPPALIVYVGDRNTWKSPSNVFRKAPWSLSSIPTIIKMKDGKEEARLVESEISSKLESFIKE